MGFNSAFKGLKQSVYICRRFNNKNCAVSPYSVLVFI